MADEQPTNAKTTGPAGKTGTDEPALSPQTPDTSVTTANSANSADSANATKAVNAAAATPNAARDAARSAAPKKLERTTVHLLIATTVGGIMGILDTTIINIALHTLVEELHTDVTTIQWVSTAYLLALTASIPMVGWAQRRFGDRHIWVTAIVIFLAGSILCATAWNIQSLIAFRIIQGVGAGFLMPLMQTISMSRVQPNQMARAMSVVSMSIALGPILGPVLGGFLLSVTTWHWLFLINVPIGAIAIYLALRFIPKDPPRSERLPRNLDIVGLVLLVPGLALLLDGLTNAHSAGGFTRIDCWGPMAAGAALLALFVLWAVRKGERAIVNIRLLKDPNLSVSSLVLTLLGATLMSAMFLLPLYLQTMRGYSVLTAAFILMPQGIGSLVTRSISGRLTDTVGPRRVDLVGFVIVLVATLPFAFAAESTPLWALMAILFVRGLGMGTVFIPVMTVSYVGIDKPDMPDASAITRTVQQIGSAFGTALSAVVLAAAMGAGSASAAKNQAAVNDAFNVAFWVPIGLAIVAWFACWLLPSDNPATIAAKAAAARVAAGEKAEPEQPTVQR